MRARVGLAGLLVAALFAAKPVAAEPTGSYGYIIPFGGYTIFDGNMRYPNAKPLKSAFNLGGRAGWQFRPWFALEAAGGFTATQDDTTSASTDVDFFHASGNLVFSPWAGWYGGPFLSAGFGTGQLKPSAGGAKLSQGNLELAGGLNFWFTDQLGARLEARDLLWLDKDQVTQVHAHTLLLGAGLTVPIGAKARDTDGDGVPDRKDKCPDTPHGATVDATGCPHDADGDGVLDGIDRCPNTPKGATVDSTGCPHDADGDGVFDGLDKCADTPKGATVDSSGCPHDSDGDGVFDGIDKCPNTPTGATVDSVGCPRDSDGDGVFDGIDKCPDTPAGFKVDANGCPVEIIERETELLDTGMLRLQNINFETGKATLLPESYPPIDVVGQVLRKWPDLQIEIGGHTDERGSAKLNKKLSEQRAQSVEEYLLQKYPDLHREQYTVKGYGPSKPLVPNTNDLNRAKNRRVEFVVMNKAVLKKEVERRMLQLQGGAPKDTTQSAPRDTTHAAPRDTTQAPHDTTKPAPPDTTKK